MPNLIDLPCLSLIPVSLPSPIGCHVSPIVRSHTDRVAQASEFLFFAPSTNEPYCARNCSPAWVTKSHKGSGCRRKHGTGLYDCNEAKQTDYCQRSINCMCGLAADKYKKPEARDALLKDPAKDWASAISWWGSVCNCDPKTLEFADGMDDDNENAA